MEQKQSTRYIITEELYYLKLFELYLKRFPQNTKPSELDLQEWNTKLKEEIEIKNTEKEDSVPKSLASFRELIFKTHYDLENYRYNETEEIIDLVKNKKKDLEELLFKQTIRELYYLKLFKLYLERFPQQKKPSEPDIQEWNTELDEEIKRKNTEKANSVPKSLASFQELIIQTSFDLANYRYSGTEKIIDLVKNKKKYLEALIKEQRSKQNLTTIRKLDERYYRKRASSVIDKEEVKKIMKKMLKNDKRTSRSKSEPKKPNHSLVKRFVKRLNSKVLFNLNP